MSALLEVENLALRFGGVKALAGVSLTVSAGEVVALVGPNGSGKTSLFNCATALYRPDSGDVRLHGRSLLGLRPHEVVRRGLARTFQTLRLFSSLTVLDNLLLGRHRHFQKSFLAALLRRRSEEVRQRGRCEEIVDFLELQAWRKARAGDCPYGVQKRVELGRALATGPELLLLDEPAAGLTAEEKEELGYWLHEIRGRLGVTLLLVEHDLSFASRICDRMVALDHGEKVAEGAPAEVQNHPAVAAAYLAV